MITASQCRMARAALGITVRELAEVAQVAPNTVVRLESGEGLHKRTLGYIRAVFEAQGITLLDPQKVSAWGGEGVRLAGTDNPQSKMAEVFQLLWDLPNFHTSPAAAFDMMLDIAERYLEVIADEQRQPDPWERIDLNDVMVALMRSQLHYAKAYLDHAIAPPDHQSPDYPIRSEYIEASATFNAEYFHRCIDALRTRGYVDRYPEVTAQRLSPETIASG